MYNTCIYIRLRSWRRWVSCGLEV